MPNFFRQKRILVLGGSGLVGRHVIEVLLEKKIRRIAIVGLKSDNGWKILEKIEKDNKLNVKKYKSDLLIPRKAKRYFFNLQLKKNVNHIIRLLTAGIKKNEIKNEPLYKIILDFKPDYIIDSINTATQCAYLNSSHTVECVGIGILLLLRYHQILFHLLQDNFWKEEKKKIRILKYIKIGTTGIGGMGLDIPFTHGEEQPSLSLLKKVAMAGTQTNILLAMQNSYNIADIQEIIPATSIFQLSNFNTRYKEIDGGESHGYALEEFRLLTKQSQMGLIDASELAKIIVDALLKEHHHHDVLVSLRKSTITKSTLSAVARNRTINSWLKDQRKYGTLSIAHGNLGPWRTRKLLFELFILLDYYHSHKADFWRLSPQKIQKYITPALSKNTALQKEIQQADLRVSTVSKKTNSDKYIDLSVKNIAKWRKALRSLGMKGKRKSSYAGDVLAQLIEKYNDLRVIP